MSNKDDLSRISLHLTLFNILLSLSFAYFIYFSHQITSIKSNMINKMMEINLIDTPHPILLLSLEVKYGDEYIRRRDSLIAEFTTLVSKIKNKKTGMDEQAKMGKEMEHVIAHIAYSYPFKNFITYNSNGTINIGPDKMDTIDLSKQIDIPGLIYQINEIRGWGPWFIQEMKNSKREILNAMMLSRGYKDDLQRSDSERYYESLLQYLDAHYQLATTIGLQLMQYQYLAAKTNLTKILIISSLLIASFACGVILPLFSIKHRDAIYCKIVPLASFALGILFLLKEAIYNITY